MPFFCEVGLGRCGGARWRMMRGMTTPDSPPERAAGSPPEEGDIGAKGAGAGEKGGDSERSSAGVLVGVLALLCLMVRLLGMNKTGGGGALPIFGDEAIYLRWAQLIREGHWWISLIDPKPPLHFWLIAVFYHWARDPLLVSRLISVVCGVLSIPALAAGCNEIAGLARGPAASGRTLGLVACVLAIFCPFLNFYQRLGTADALFILEMLVAVWLSLRWARLVVGKKGAWGTAVALGVAMGAAMMTRQGVSYVWWAIPPVAVLLRGPRVRVIFRAVGQLGVAGVIALVLWVPYLTADFQRFAGERGGTAAEVKIRILYQNQFTDGSKSRGEILKANAMSVFVPTWGSDGEAETGWLFLYLTWPVYFASVGGLVWLAFQRQWKVLAILVLWSLLMIGVPMALGAVLRSRYIVAGVPPLLIAGSYFILELLGLALSVRRQWVGWCVGAFFFAGMIVLPLREIGKQGTVWWAQTLTREDRYQHVTGWTAGTATMEAIEFIRNFVPRSPGQQVVVITNDGWGTPADAEWVYLSGVPNVTVYYTNHKDRAPLLEPSYGGEADTYMLRKDKWLYTPEVAVHIPSAAIILYMNNDPVYTKDGPVDPGTYFGKVYPNLVKAETFYNHGTGADRVVLFELKRETRKNHG